MNHIILLYLYLKEVKYLPMFYYYLAIYIRSPAWKFFFFSLTFYPIKEKIFNGLKKFTFNSFPHKMSRFRKFQQDRIWDRIIYLAQIFNIVYPIIFSSNH